MKRTFLAGILVGAVGLGTGLVLLGAGETSKFRVAGDEYALTPQQFETIVTCLQDNSEWSAGELDVASVHYDNGVPRLRVSYDIEAPADSPPAKAVGYSQRVFKEVFDAAHSLDRE